MSQKLEYNFRLDVDSVVDQFYEKAMKELEKLPFDENEMTHIDGIHDMIGELVSDFGFILKAVVNNA